MGYELHGLIGAREIVAHAADRLGVPITDLPQGFALVPGPLLDPDDDAPACSWPLGQPFWHLIAGWEQAAVDASDAGPIAYVEADLFGGVGTQAAVVWHHRAAVLGPITVTWPRTRRRDPIPIEQALAALGVHNPRSGNPFDALDLGRYRRSEDWIDATAT